MAIPNIDELSRPDLLNIFYHYAMPKHRRTPNTSTSQSTSAAGKHISSTENETNKSVTNGCKRNHERIVFDDQEREITKTDTQKRRQLEENRKSMENVTNECKKIRLDSTTEEVCVKRQVEQMVRVFFVYIPLSRRYRSYIYYEVQRHFEKIVPLIKILL